jgi:hypothetical protein
MYEFEIKEAKREGQWARIALPGPSGSGKTFTALKLAQGLTRNGKIIVIDSERDSAKKYADILGKGVKFDVVNLPNFSPAMYAECIKYVLSKGYDAVITDSISHAWMGKGGALEMVDKAAKKSNSGNTFAAWRDVNPVLAELTDVIMSSKAHMIVTMRTKSEYVMETNEKGKIVPKKIGLAPIQRDGFEYEFDIVANMDMNNNLIIDKTRLPFLNGEVFHKPTEALGKAILEWLDGNDPEPDKPEPVIEEAKVDTAVVLPAVSSAPNDDRLQRIGGLMKRKGVKLDDVVALYGKNPREMTTEMQDSTILWLEERP